MLSSGGSRLSDKGVGYPSASASDSDDPVFADENGDVLILLTPIPSRLRLRFLIFTRSKRSYDSAYDSVASENQPWGKVRQLILSAIEGKKKQPLSLRGLWIIVPLLPVRALTCSTLHQARDQMTCSCLSQAPPSSSACSEGSGIDHGFLLLYCVRRLVA